MTARVVRIFWHLMSVIQNKIFSRMFQIIISIIN